MHVLHAQMGEQDNDRKPWGGASSKLGGVAAMFGCAGGPAMYTQMGVSHHISNQMRVRVYVYSNMHRGE